MVGAIGVFASYGARVERLSVVLIHQNLIDFFDMQLHLLHEGRRIEHFFHAQSIARGLAGISRPNAASGSAQIGGTARSFLCQTHGAVRRGDQVGGIGDAPPLKRATISAWAASKSTMRPLPSSPHCVPMTMSRGMKTSVDGIGMIASYTHIK